MASVAHAPDSFRRRRRAIARLMVRASRWSRPLLVLACVAATALAGARLAGGAVPGWLLGAALACVVGLVTLGVAWIGSGVFARPVLAVEPARAGSRFALTFDDGPDPVVTRRVLDLLDGRGHRATFFVIGRHVERHADVVAEIARRGHGLGNHSFAHAWLGPLRSPAWLESDLLRASEAIVRAGAARPRFFRPPVGLVSPPVAAAARRADLEIVGWTRTARDGTTLGSVERATARLLGALRPGAILVLHDGAERGDRAPIAVEVLARLLDAAEASGLRSVTLDELLSG